MQINSSALEKILSCNDEELKKVISAAASEGGISLPNISAADILRLRAALGSIGSSPEAITNLIKSTEVKKKSDH